MLRWTWHVAEGVRSRLASALNTADPSSYVSVFLDDRALRSGDPLTETLREKAQRSALLLVFMSGLYPRRRGVLTSLSGSSFGPAAAGKTTVLLVQPIDDIDWPKHLRDEAGKPVFSHDFLDRAAGLPIGFGNHELPALNDAIRKVHIELKGKLEQLRAQYQARRVYEQTTVPPTQPVLYLQARRQNLPIGRLSARHLNHTLSLTPTAFLSPLARTRSSNSSDRGGSRSTLSVTGLCSSALAPTRHSASR